MVIKSRLFEKLVESLLGTAASSYGERERIILILKWSLPLKSCNSSFDSWLI